MLKKIYAKIKSYGMISVFTVLVGIVYMIAWVTNSIYSTRFVLKELLDLYQLMIPQILKYGLDSIFNTERGTTSEKKDGATFYAYVDTDDALKKIENPNLYKIYFVRTSGNLYKYKDNQWVIVLNPREC